MGILSAYTLYSPKYLTLYSLAILIVVREQQMRQREGCELLHLSTE